MTKFFKWHNQILEENAVKLCYKQSNDMVLEIGHGLGLGLQAASQLLTDPEVKLLGVDYFQYIVIKAANMKVLTGDNWHTEVYMEALKIHRYNDKFSHVHASLLYRG
uniref:Uncharacterized protein n=1 Tax=Sinocyclocheilus anshuiensis TaxID=1608454 RepID=A0A671NFH7_9TELE